MVASKRKRDDARDDEGPNGDDTEEDGEVLNEYERERAAIIARNRARLEELGVKTAYQAFEQSFGVAKKPKPKKEKIQRSKTKIPERRSTRQRGQEAEKRSELGTFLVEGTCPRCGQPFTHSHRRHLEQCTLKKLPQGRELDEDDFVEADERKPAKRPSSSSSAKTQAEKLAELELSGLVSFSKTTAEFVVLGSTAKHYTVTFDSRGSGVGAGKSSCQCMDYRLRRHTCKHIRLILQQLGIENAPDRWRQAIRRNFADLQSING